ncbi:hypothetical protein MJ585_11175 [Klebsiella pneumoniae]|nr:hypothetical protein MJ585_11175 [Klebsiella pneumoniae]
MTTGKYWAEPIQTVMRRYGIEKPNEAERADPRQRVDAEGMKQFIDSLALPEEEKCVSKR